MGHKKTKKNFPGSTRASVEKEMGMSELKGDSMIDHFRGMEGFVTCHEQNTN
jgi:hypothetical protein